ncbi:hypothetical protein FDZ71_11635, partial [bacterium]
MPWDVEDYYYDIEESEETELFLSTLVKLRANLYLDPDLVRLWSCDPQRCRPFMGRNLCCKVEMRCASFVEGICLVHDDKPFSCALFPLDILRFGQKRALVSAGNPLLYKNEWTRFDRDMLDCFSGEIKSEKTMFETQEFLLEKVFTRAEFHLLKT